MDKLIIEGGARLQGDVQITGAKNAALPLMAATILAEGKSVLRNTPNLADVRTMGRVISELGADVEHNCSVISIDASTITSDVAPYELVKTMRASFYALGALLGRLKRAKVSLPGGCAWGPRPVDIHLKGLEALGVKINMEKGYIIADGSDLHGAKFVLDFPSVGATINILLAAVAAEGETLLDNVAREPEVTAVVRMLIQMGAEISGAGTGTLVIQGGRPLHAVELDVIPDRIEAGTYLAAVALVGGDVMLRGADPEHLTMVLTKAAEAGIKVSVTTEGIRVERNGDLRAVDVETAVYPGFATDMQAQWIALMSGASGTSLITDTIYTDRFTHVAELVRLGADITMKENIAKIHGHCELVGAPVMSTDLRASASLVIAGLAASGRTEISRIYHLDRGYEKLESKLEAIGARIWREKE